ncbi:MAG: hypothetical protein PVF10_08410, partial [Syntrophobacterales bacterium]
GPSLSASCCGNGIAFSPADVLYHATEMPLNTLDQSTGAATLVTNLLFSPPADTRPRINGMDFHPNSGILYASLNDRDWGAPYENHLATVNVATGVVTIIGPTVDGLTALAVAPSTPGPPVYGVSSIDQEINNLYRIDMATGATTLIGPIGFKKVSAMDFGPDGKLYAAGKRTDGSETHVLITIDHTTGVGTEIGPTGVEALGYGNTMSDISFRNSDGALYAYLEAGDGVGTIDPSTGAATALGPSLSASCCGNGIAFSPADVLYHATELPLNTLDQSTGAATLVTNLLFSPPADTRPRINGMDFHPSSGILYASLNDGYPGARENYFATVNVSTGVVTILGPTVDGLTALAFPPDPAAAPPAAILGADFGASGLYTYDQTAWDRINSNNPAGLGAYGNKLVANFPGMGLYEYDGTDWQRINTNDGAENMVTVDSILYVDFGAPGLYGYDGSSWGRIVRMDASVLASFDGKLAVTFPGRGLYVYDGGWSRITRNDTAETMIGVGSMLYVEFSNGLWEYNGTSFRRLTRWEVSSLATYDGKLAVNFPGHGLYEYDGSWSRINKNDTAQGMCGVGSVLYVDFGATGLYRYDGSFQRVSTNNCEDMVAAELP